MASLGFLCSLVPASPVEFARPRFSEAVPIQEGFIFAPRVSPCDGVKSGQKPSNPRELVRRYSESPTAEKSPE